MAVPDARFQQAAWSYVVYGVLYWLGGLVLVAAGLRPPVPDWVVAALFAAGAGVVALVPWLLHRERPWFDRWLLSRRDFARILTLVVAYRAYEVARIAWDPRVELVSVGGFAIPMRLGAVAFFVVTVLTVVMLARAAWARQP